MMKEDFVTFEQAKLLKELGFDGFNEWECDYWYYFPFNNHNKPIFEYCETTDYYEVDKCWYAPTLAMAQKWLREVKGVDVIVLKYANDYVYTVYFKDRVVNGDLCETYEQALLMGIGEVLKIFKRRMR